MSRPTNARAAAPGSSPSRPGPGGGTGGRPSGGGLRGLFATLRRLVAGRPASQAGASRQGPALPANASPGAATPLGAGWELPARPSVQMRWKKDMPGQARTSRVPAREWTIQRQILLVLAALATVGAVTLAYGARFLVDRTLPMSVRGVWTTNSGRYAQRLFELAGSRLAFQVSDSSAAIHDLTRVRHADGEAGTLYQVEYRDLGETYEFSFVYSAGPPEEIRFLHQPFMVWTRVTDRRGLLPEIF